MDDLDRDKLAEVALALLSLTLHEERRVWKSIDWDVLVPRIRDSYPISAALAARLSVTPPRRCCGIASSSFLDSHADGSPILGTHYGYGGLDVLRGSRNTFWPALDADLGGEPPRKCFALPAGARTQSRRRSLGHIGHDFRLGHLDLLHAKGWISDPNSKAKSVILTLEGFALAETMLEKHFAKRP